MEFLLYVPLIGLVTIGILFPSILVCCCKNNEKIENIENNENNEKTKLNEKQNKIKFYDPLLL